MGKKVVIIGAGGHAKVIADIILKRADTLIGFLDDNIKVGTKIDNQKGFEVLGKVNTSLELQEKDSELEFIIGIGNNNIRKNIAEEYDLKYYTAIHPTANIGFGVVIKEGTTIMANACISPSTYIGKHCIINTAAIVEHDNIIKEYVHISPNATLAGTVVVGVKSHIGAGATIINNVNVTSNVIIGAGAVVTKDITESGTYVGVPAKKIK